MSRRCWNSVEDRRKLAKIDHLFRYVLDRAQRHRILQGLNNYDSDSDESVDDDFDVPVNAYAHALRQVANVANVQ